MNSKLISINTLIEDARKQGADFGQGDPKIHVTYLTKLGLLPNAVKRKIDGQIVGCYPKSAVEILVNITKLKSKGMTYSQIAKTDNQLVTEVSLIEQPASSIFNPSSSDFVLHMKPSNFVYLFLGLVIGVIVSTLNTSGLNAMNKSDNLTLGESVEITNKSGESDIYMIAVPKHNLDNLSKTNINYLIKN